MRIEGTFLRSKVARRIVLFFVFSALIPLGVSLALVFGQVQSLLVEQGHARLAQTSEGYAAYLYDRLLAASERVSEIAARIAEGVPPGVEDRERLQRQFRAIGTADGKTPYIRLNIDSTSVSTPVPTIPQLAQGRVGLAVASESPREGRVLLAAALDPAQPTAARLVAEIDPLYLWGEVTALPAMTGVCVVDDADIVLFCSDEAGAAAAAKLSRSQVDSAAGSFSYEFAGKAYLADYRELFLKPQFGVRGWTIISSKLESDVFAPIAAFKTIFFPVIFLALLVVALLSVTQVRRTLGPLEKLIDGTRRAGERDFSARVEIPSDDEFGELATSFNSMASRLGGQFTALLTLADIDHAILSRLDLDRVAETVVTRMRDIVPADYVSIAIVDRNAPAMACVYTRDQRGEHDLGLARCGFAARDTLELLAHPDGVWLERARAQSAFLAPILALGAASLLVLPIVWQKEVVGTVILGFDGAPLLTDEERTRAKNLGDRVGVAFATAAKDEQLYYQANYDTLTGLPNRLYFKDQLARRLAQSEREPGPFALLFIDLDHFKNVNDSLGHTAGDEVLRQAAERLKGCVRDVDTVTRLGGDEFTIILSQIRSHLDPERVAEHVLDMMRLPFTVAGNEHYLNASIGIAVHPSDGVSSDELLRNADTAMYRAKETGRGRYVYFEERMNIAALARLNLERELRKAMERNEFRVWYQPQLDMRSGRLSGAEALLRWESPDRGLRLPAEFIAVAEDSGLIEPIGQWVLREACRQFVAWRAEGIVVPHIAVNVSARQFRQKGFVDSIAAIVRETGIEPRCLELEITESLLIDAKSGTAGLLEALRRMGITIGLDDFGTGYSSLAYLKRFPVNTVKIDRSFVTDLSTSKDAGAIAAAVIAMAHALEKRVVAEGVETEAQSALLTRLGCDHIQGYYYSAPLPATMFAAFVGQESAGPGLTSPTPDSRVAIA